DGSHPDPISQINAVNEVLANISGVEDIPQIMALNKSDMMSDAARERFSSLYSDAVIVSAFSGENLQILRNRLEELLPSPRVRVDVTLPYEFGGLLSKVRENGVVEKAEYVDSGVELIAWVGPSLAAKLMKVAL
ncbi:GTPase HflX, partial [Bifidobacteriaceae bacterium NR020]